MHVLYCIIYIVFYCLSLTMCREMSTNGTCTRGTGLAGKAFLGAACSKTVPVAITHDRGAYQGVKVVSHEMAHL